MTRMFLVAFALSLAGTAGCMHAGHAAGVAQPASPTAPDTSAMRGMAEMCPMSVPGTQVEATDLTNGVALTFTTTAEKANALREKVRAMADMHNHHHAGGEHAHDAMHHGGMGPGGMMGGMGGMGMGGTGGMGAMGGMAHGHGGMQMPPPSRASVEDVPNGARLLLTPNDPADLQRLQAAVRSHGEYMQQHGCEMMGQGG